MSGAGKVEELGNWKRPVIFVENQREASGQVIATSHEFSAQMVVKSKGVPRKFQGNLGW